MTEENKAWCYSFNGEVDEGTLVYLAECEKSEFDRLTSQISEYERVLEKELFEKLKMADIEHTQEKPGASLEDWDEILECEVKHFNQVNSTDFDPKEMRFQYIEKFKTAGY